MLAITFIGFSKFYMRGQAHPGRPIPPAILAVVVTHAVSMSAWTLLFVMQPMLIAMRGYRAHKFVGRIGSVLALAIVVSGVWVTFASARIAPPDMRWWGMNAAQFTAVPLISVALFGAFVGVGIWKRKTANVHKACMLLATVAALAAPLGRMDYINSFYANTIIEKLLTAFPYTLLVGVLLLAIKSLLERSLDRAMAMGVSLMAVVYVATSLIAMTETWGNLMARVVGIPM
jgi:uncharacterized membrane protein YozB (DUF420 family)